MKKKKRYRNLHYLNEFVPLLVALKETNIMYQKPFFGIIMIKKMTITFWNWNKHNNNQSNVVDEKNTWWKNNRNCTTAFHSLFFFWVYPPHPPPPKKKAKIWEKWKVSRASYVSQKLTTYYRLPRATLASSFLWKMANILLFFRKS